MNNFFAAIGRFFSSAWRTLGEYLKIAIPEVTAGLLNDLLAVADPIVADLNNQALTGQQKRDQAASLIQAQVVKAGWDVTANLVHAAIELAVLKLRATTPTTPVAVGGNLPGGVAVTPPAVA